MFSTQSLAQGIRSQFQLMVEEYGLEGIGELMPLVVNVREKLDSALADNQVGRLHELSCRETDTDP